MPRRRFAARLHAAGRAPIVQGQRDFFDQFRRCLGTLAVLEIAVPLARDAQRFGEFFLRYGAPDSLWPALIFADRLRLGRDGLTS